MNLLIKTDIMININLHKNNFEFICPEDDIKREIFTKESLLEPFETFELKFIEEKSYDGCLEKISKRGGTLFLKIKVSGGGNWSWFKSQRLQIIEKES